MLAIPVIVVVFCAVVIAFSSSYRGTAGLRAALKCLTAVLIGGSYLGLTSAQAYAAFTPGNLLASVGGGLVKEFRPNGELVETYDTGVGSITTGSTFDASGNFYVTDFNGNAVSIFNPLGALTGTFGSGYNSDPESIVFDGSGNAYIGQADGEGTVLKFDSAGNPLESFSPEREDRGIDWVALASDECTLYYTSEGQSIKRYNVCTHEQLSDFVDNLPGQAAYQIRFLPDGGLLVADSGAILRLDASGHISQEYTAPGNSEWFNVQFSPGSSVFWAGDIASGNVAEFDLNSGNLLEEFNTSPVAELAGLTVIGSPDYVLKDSDGDGLPDEWEEQGLRDPEGHMLVNLPAMGADPKHKDVFVQLDAMHHLALSHQALGMVEAAFNDAPVSNPDGTTGIHLHVDEGPTSTMKPGTSVTWGSLSLANDDIPFQKTFGSTTGNRYNWSAFDTVKHRSLVSGREAVFHYAISVNRFSGLFSGESRHIPASDFIVALGPACHPEGACPGPTMQQAGTFMHELGHNLGLHHGGQVDELFVPNYFSVMNYTFQFSGISSSPAGVDYSRYDSAQVPTLDETNLDEPTGFGISQPNLVANQKTRIWCGGGFHWETVSLGGPVDFNCDGNHTGSGVVADLHNSLGFGPNAAPQPPAFQHLGPLKSYDDWNDLWYRGGAVGGNGLGAVLPEETENEDPEMQTLTAAADDLVPPPTGETGNATGITESLATLHGEVTPNGEETTVSFQYGPTPDYGSKTADVAVGSAHVGAPTSADLTGLVPDTTYHYQEVIETPTHLLYGADETFATHAGAGAPLSSTPQPASVAASEPAAEAHQCIVPRLRGKTTAHLGRLLAESHCALGHKKVPKSVHSKLERRHLRVVHQSEPPGTLLPEGTAVDVTLAIRSKRTHHR